MEQSLDLPTKRGNFILRKVLGKGAYGEVYLATYENTNQYFAIKKIQRSQVERNEKTMRYFAAETRLMSQFNHPNLIKVLSLLITTNSFYVVLEYCNSGCLNSKIKQVEDKDDFIPERTCLIYLFQIVAGITEMHSRKVLHRDIKPDNILFHNDTIKIADYGFAKQLLDSEYTTTKVGTPLYQAPEIMCTEHETRYTSAVDIWSIGVTFFKMIYKTHPWKTRDGSNSITRADLKVAVLTQSGINLVFPSFPQVSPDTKELLRKMIEPKPEKRITLYEIIMHPAFRFIQAPNLNAADASLNVQEKAKKLLTDLQKQPSQFFKDLNFEPLDNPSTQDRQLESDECSLNELSKSLKIPDHNPITEFNERYDHEKFFINQICTWVQNLKKYLPTITPWTNTFWVGILWSLMAMAKKAETYSLDLYENLQKRVNQFNIAGFDQKVKNSNGYENELANFKHLKDYAKEALNQTLDFATEMSRSFDNLQRSRDSLLKLHNEMLLFCKKTHDMQTVQQKMTDNILMVCQVFFKTRTAMGLINDDTTKKWIVVLDILVLRDIEVQVERGVQEFLKGQFFDDLSNPRYISSRIEEMATTRFKQFC